MNEELDKAKVSLNKASQYADAKTAASIKAIDASISKLKKDTKNSVADVKEQYDAVKTKMNKLIHQF